MARKKNSTARNIRSMISLYHLCLILLLMITIMVDGSEEKESMPTTVATALGEGNKNVRDDIMRYSNKITPITLDDNDDSQISTKSRHLRGLYHRGHYDDDYYDEYYQQQPVSHSNIYLHNTNNRPSNNNNNNGNIQRPVNFVQLQQQLVYHASLWRSWQIADYIYNYEELGPNPRNIMWPLLVQVEFQTLVSGRDANNNPIFWSNPPLYAIEELFYIIDEALSGPLRYLSVVYEPNLGYPVAIQIEYANRPQRNAQFSAVITNFRLLEIATPPPPTTPPPTTPAPSTPAPTTPAPTPRATP